jgi:hypothetical protein
MKTVDLKPFNQHARECGTCTLCCLTHGVSPRSGESFQKKERVWCEHCAIGNGCKIYNARPGACQEFVCGWLEGLGTIEERPDITHIVMHRFSIGDGITVLKMVESSISAFQSPAAQRVIHEQVQLGDLVALRYFDGAIEFFVRNGGNVPVGLQIELKNKNIPVKRLG